METGMNHLAQLLRERISSRLPGTDVQWEMASSDRMVKDFPRVPGPDARVAAVLILLFPAGGQICTVFMQRHYYDGVHGGQISFPGGKKEPGDKDVINTAIREAQEETGIDPSLISIIGTLTPLFIPVSNMIVTPVVGWSETKPLFTHQPGEVVFLFEAKLSRLLDKSGIKTRPFEINGETIDIRYFDYDGNVIWGATAMMLHELLTIIREMGITTFLQA